MRLATNAYNVTLSDGKKKASGPSSLSRSEALDYLADRMRDLYDEGLSRVYWVNEAAALLALADELPGHLP
jgi:hypothetical protein